MTFSPFFHLGSFWTVAALRSAAETEKVRGVGSSEGAGARWRGAKEVGRRVDMAEADEVRRAVAEVRLQVGTTLRARADMAGRFCSCGSYTAQRL